MPKQLTKPTPTIASEISKARREQKLSLRQLAEKTDLSHQSIFKLEQGGGKLTTATRVMRALGVPRARVTRLVQLRVAHMLAMPE